MNIEELYNHLLKENILWPTKVRIHTSQVVSRVQELLYIDQASAETVAHELILRFKRSVWMDALSMNYPNSTQTLSDKLEWLLDMHFMGQSSDIWWDIKRLLVTFNSRYPKSKLPTDKINIALSLFWKRSMNIMEFISILWLCPQYIRHSSGESAENIRELWRYALGVFFHHDKKLTLRQHLLELLLTPWLFSQKKWKILELLKQFYSKTKINLWYTSWTTLSRWIKWKDCDYLWQEEFYRFIRE